LLLDKLEGIGTEVRSVGKIFRRFPRARHQSSIQNEEQRRRHAENASKPCRVWIAASFTSTWSISTSNTGIGTTWKAMPAPLRVRRLAARVPRRAAADDLRHPHRRSRLRPDDAIHRPQSRIHPAAGLRPRVRAGVDLGLRATLSDIGQTVAENFATSIEKGTSFLSEISL